MAAFDDKQEAEMMDAVHGVQDEPEKKSNEKKKRKEKRKRKQMEEAKNRGVCYISRVPPKMDPFTVGQLLPQYGEIQRVYLPPKNPMQHKKAARFRGQEFSEGWVEFKDKHVAKRVAKMLNGQQIGGKKRSQFYYDLWNIKYLSKFKWDDLTEEITYKRAVRQQKLVMEMSAAKKERDFYLSKVEKSHALSAIEERMKKQKVQKGWDSDADRPTEGPSKVVRLFPQTKPLKDAAEQGKPGFNKALLDEVFKT